MEVKFEHEEHDKNQRCDECRGKEEAGKQQWSVERNQEDQSKDPENGASNPIPRVIDLTLPTGWLGVLKLLLPSLLLCLQGQISFNLDGRLLLASLVHFGMVLVDIDGDSRVVDLFVDIGEPALSAVHAIGSRFVVINHGGREVVALPLDPSFHRG